MIGRRGRAGATPYTGQPSPGLRVGEAGTFLFPPSPDNPPMATTARSYFQNIFDNVKSIAPALCLAWSALRAPTSAAVIPGSWAVQLMITCA